MVVWAFKRTCSRCDKGLSVWKSLCGRADLPISWSSADCAIVAASGADKPAASASSLLIAETRRQCNCSSRRSGVRKFTVYHPFINLALQHQK